jgi:subtilase family serine protease
MMSAALVDRAHHAVSTAQLHDLLVRTCPAIAAGLPQSTGGAPKGAGGPAGGAVPACQQRLSHHLQQLITYQPPSHYSPLQALETGIFLAAAFALIGATVWGIGRRATRKPAAGESGERSADPLTMEVAAETGVRVRGHQRENEMKAPSMDLAERRRADRRPRPALRWFAAALVTVGVLVSGCGGSSSMTSSGHAQQQTHAAPSGPSATATGDCDSLTSCFTPRQLETAYGIRPLLARGIDGRGETVVLPEIAEGLFPPSSYSDLRADIARFDQLFGLPAPKLRVINSLAHSGRPWSADGEEVLDAEMVHAAAPGAAITIVLITPSSFHSAKSGVVAAVAVLGLGVREGAVISISAAGQTGGEHCDTPSEARALDSALVDAADRRVTVVAASGDIGAAGEPCDLAEGLFGGSFPPVREVNLPASDPLVLAAGGTTLTASHKTGRYIAETGWGLPYGAEGTQVQASGGGFSHEFARPIYQSGLSAAETGRGVPDVTANAAPHTGMALVISTGGRGYTIRNSGGTSAAAPLWAGVIALADQYARRHLGIVNAAIYRIAQTTNNAFHRITTGNNTVSFPPHTIIGYHAGRGWNPVTGWGSPNASVLVPLLARYSRS